MPGPVSATADSYDFREVSSEKTSSTTSLEESFAALPDGIIARVALGPLFLQSLETGRAILAILGGMDFGVSVR